MSEIRKYIELIESHQHSLFESKNHPIICVDVQPAYDNSLLPEIIEFVASSNAPVLKFVNAEESGIEEDTIDDIKYFWEESYEEEIDWDRFQIVDKGYGHFRAWMDNGIDPSIIIKMIRYMYQVRENDSRDLFGGEDDDEYEDKMQEFVGDEYEDWMLGDPILINWTSVSQLKEFNGAYIVGGGRNECLREVELLMNAFNIKYKRIDHLVYG